MINEVFVKQLTKRNINTFFSVKNIIKKSNFILLFFCFLLLPKKLDSQNVSKKFDSIISLSISNEEKIAHFEILFKEYRRDKDFKQLGEDSHELAKKLYKIALEKAVLYNEIAVEAKLKVLPIDSCSLQKSYYNVGFFNRKNKNYSKAIEGYKNVLKFKNCEDYSKNAKRFITQSYTKLAETSFQLKDYFLSVANYEEVLKFVDTSNLVLRINTHLTVTRAYKNLRNVKSNKKAIYHLHMADSLYNLLPEKQNDVKFTIYNNLAGLYSIDKTTKDKAFYYYDKAQDLLKKLNNPNESQLFYLNLGLFYEKIDLKKSKEYYEESLKYKEANSNYLARTYLSLGTNASLNKNYQVAQKFYLQSLSCFFKNKSKNESNFISDKELQEVEDKELLLELFRSQIENWDRWINDVSSKEKTNLILKKAILSDRLIDFMIKDNLSYRAKLFLRNLASEIYILALEACYQSKEVEKAFYFAEKNKALLLIQEIKNQNVLEKDTTNIIANDYFNNPIQTEILPLSSVKLKPDEIVLHYVMAERLEDKTPDAYLIYISKNEKIIFKINKVGELISNVKLLREKLEKPFETENDIKIYQRVSNSIYNSLIPREVQQKLNNKKVTIIGDHIINLIPFQALNTNQNKKYLIETVDISYDYSLTFRNTNKTVNRNISQQFLGIAPVNFDNNLSSLKNSTLEIETAEKHYSGKLLLNAKATKANFINNTKDFKIIHLATHAYASDSIKPWIAFKDGKLELKELNNIKNKADLVVLSACNTSLGEVVRGEGVMSLARSFFRTGAKAVIPSLWKTNDKATTSIVSKFYELLSQGKTKSEALREAKINFINNNVDAEASPYYWAPLVIVGDNSTIIPETDFSNNYIFLILLLGLILFLTLKKFINKNQKYKL
ncbi:CHAT domain-containing tetratricopeptide repeat protein [uncultured Tenacibaculum sp.]|uniref:CHAT domain-containing protein n=1 Tax=uncultured Tenacibaculum sp. TaxID=174713 RepID=UPI00262AAE44|nr:CHAT domain-containing tetratricopeptide repeat protein [uncultured Tenacibaculum sp.]